MNYKFTTIKVIEADNEASSIWCVNKSDPRGEINVNMPDGLGGALVMRIPITWIPIDLTTQATKESLLKSPIFRRLVANGAIGLMEEKEALLVMEEKDAKHEAQRVYSVIQNQETLPEPSELNKIKEEESGKISGFAMNITSIDLEDDQILTMIRGQDGVLTSADYKYISVNSDKAKVKEYCASAALR